MITVPYLATQRTTNNLQPIDVFFFAIFWGILKLIYSKCWFAFLREKNEKARTTNVQKTFFKRYFGLRS